jgi:cell division septation protein DedD
LHKELPVTEPEDRESKPAPPKPSDSGEAYLSPRLREKLGQAKGGDDEDFMKSSFPTGAVVAVLLIVAVVGGGWWMVRTNSAKAKAELERGARAAAAARAAAVADSLAAVYRADSLAAVARADSIAFAKLPKWQQRKILAERAKLEAGAAPTGAAPAGETAAEAASGPDVAERASSEPPAPREQGPFAIDTGQFIDEARANQVADALKTKTPMAVQVVSVATGGESAYHVMLGSFATRSAAEQAATKIFESGIVEQASVVALPKSP